MLTFRQFNEVLKPGDRVLINPHSELEKKGTIKKRVKMPTDIVVTGEPDAAESIVPYIVDYDGGGSGEHQAGELAFIDKDED